MHIQNLLKPLEDLEATLFRLYQYLGELFPLDEEAKALFYRMSIEEKSHVVQVRYQKKLVLQNPGIFSQVQIDTTEIRALTDEANAIMTARRRLTVGEAALIALRFETTAAESHLRSAIRQANPDLVRLLTALGAGDKQHLENLIEFMEKRGIDPRSAASG